MFKFFKEKLEGWTKKVSEEQKDKLEEEIIEKKPKKKVSEKVSVKDVPVPMKFNDGMQQFQPDLEKLEKVQKEIIEENEPGTKSFFEKIKSKTKKVKISEKEFEIYEEDLRMLLLENNVAFEVADKIISDLREELIGKELLKKELESEVKEVLKKIIEDILVSPFDIIERIEKKKEDSKSPFVIMFLGVNGTGKTTSVAKIADFIKRKKFSCVLAAADTFRAASIEQLEKHGERIGVKVISHEYNSDPASVGFDAIKYAEKNSIDVVLIDTAGRMHSSKNLLKELEKISRVCSPDLKIFVGESTTGNDSVEQVKSFEWAVGIDGIILTKADVDEKGGTALSVGYVTKKPILFLGTGQEYDQIEVFDKNKFLKEIGL